jgi:hypothetical protein
MIAWWSGDGTANDLTADHDGALWNGASYAPGKAGLAFSLDGVNDYVEVPDSPQWAFGTGPFTIELWANFATSDGWHTFLASDDGGGNQNKWAFWLQANLLVFHLHGVHGYADIGMIPFSPTLGEWYHVALTREGSTYTFYTNGVVAGIASESRAVPDASAPLTIGMAEGQFRFSGRLDEITLYDRALDPFEIAAIHAAGSIGKCKPPSVAVTVPRNGENQVATQTILSATFSTTVDPASIQPDTFLLLDRNRDPVAGVVSFDPTTAVLSFTPSVPLQRSNLYVATVRSGVRNLHGEAMRHDHSWHFASSGLVTTLWWIGESGDWSHPANWSDGRIPGPDDEVLIDNPSAECQVTVSGGDHSIRSLVSNNLLHLNGCSLAFAESITSSAEIRLDLGARLRGGTVRTMEGTRLVGASGVLEGVRLEGELDLASVSGAAVRVEEGLELAGLIRIGGPGTWYNRLEFPGQQQLSGVGRVVFGGGFASTLAVTTAGGVLTIGPGIEVALATPGAGGLVGYQHNTGLPQEVGVINQGRILADVQDGRLSITGATFMNEGWIGVENGATLDLDSESWINAGQIQLSQAVLNLNGSFAVADLGEMTTWAGEVSLRGQLNNVGTVLRLDGQSGSWRLNGGRIVGGTVRTMEGTRLVGASGVLEGVRLEGELDLASVSGAAVRVEEGLELAGLIRIGGPGTWYNRLEFPGQQQLSGVGRVVFGGGFASTLAVTTAGGVLTIGPGIEVALATPGAGGLVGYQHNTGLPQEVGVINQGRILADVQDGRLSITGATFMNEGWIGVENGATLDLDSESWINAGQIQLSQAVLNLNGSFAVADLGEMTTWAGEVSLRGQLNNVGTVLRLDGQSGSWRLNGGRIVGGTVRTMEGTRLVGASGVLEGVRLEGELDLASVSGAAVRVEEGLELAGLIRIGGPGTWYNRLEFPGQQQLSGVGRVVFGGGFASTLAVTTAGGVLTIGPGIEVALATPGAGGLVGYQHNTGLPQEVGVINQGRILADVQDGRLSITGATFMNEGWIGVENGATLDLDSESWINAGQIQLSQAVLNLNGSFAVADLGEMTTWAGEVSLRGQLNNVGTVLRLDGQSGSWRLNGGRIVGGTVRTMEGTRLVGASGVLEGVRLEGELDLASVSGAAVRVEEGLELAGLIRIGGPGTWYNRLEFPGQQQLSGVGRVVFGGGFASTLAVTTAGGVLTIGPGIEVALATPGAGGLVGYQHNTGLPQEVGVINQGRILADVQDGRLVVEAHPFINEGILLSAAGRVEVRAWLGDPFALHAPEPPEAGRTYQWRLNGANIPGATNATFAIGSLRGTESGSYSVVVADQDESSAATFEIAVLVIDVPPLAAADQFAERTALPSHSGLAGGSNIGATKETGEPNHGGKPGGRSVWYRWLPQASGIATVRTAGSAFDTLLSVYTGSEVTALTLVAEDEDSGGYLTSEVRFNVAAGVEYQLALDGFAGADGWFVITWDLWETSLRLPVIVRTPSGLVAAPGSMAVFEVEALGQDLSYRWFRNGLALEAATDPVLALPEAGTDDVGAYEVEITGAGSLTVASVPVWLELGSVGVTLSEVKLEDLVTRLTKPIRPAGFVAVSLGSVGNQWLHSFGATTQEGEPNHAGGIGGASRWLGIEPAESGVLAVDTLGSEVDAYVAVYTGLDIRSLTPVVGTTGESGSVRVPVQAGRPYLVAVDTPRGQEAQVQVNWGLGLAPVFTNSMAQWIGVPGMPLELQAGLIPGTGESSYQWLLAGMPIPGATNAVYSVARVSEANAGRYDLVVNNRFGVLTNGVAEVRVTESMRLAARIESAEGQPQLRISATGSLGCVLETSSDLQTWLPVWTNTLSGENWEYHEPESLRNCQRFYRAQPWP